MFPLYSLILWVCSGLQLLPLIANIYKIIPAHKLSIFICSQIFSKSNYTYLNVHVFQKWLSIFSGFAENFSGFAHACSELEIRVRGSHSHRERPQSRGWKGKDTRNREDVNFHLTSQSQQTYNKLVLTFHGTEILITSEYNGYCDMHFLYS